MWVGNLISPAAGRVNRQGTLLSGQNDRCRLDEIHRPASDLIHIAEKDASAVPTRGPSSADFDGVSTTTPRVGRDHDEILLRPVFRCESTSRRHHRRVTRRWHKASQVAGLRRLFFWIGD